MPKRDKPLILVVDDEEDIRKVLTFRLEEAGYDVVTAPDGDTGLKTATERSPDLIILDMNMPGKTGLQFYNEILMPDSTPMYPTLILTARGELQSLFNQIQADGFMPKPFDIVKLIKEIEVILSVRKKVKRLAEAENAAGRKFTKVLIAESDDQVLGMLVLAFVKAGCEVIAAMDGLQAVEKILGDVPDLMIFNLSLPEMNGDDVMARLKKLPRTADKPMLLYTETSRELSKGTVDQLCEKCRIPFEHFIRTNTPEEIMNAAEPYLTGGE